MNNTSTVHIPNTQDSSQSALLRLVSGLGFDDIIASIWRCKTLIMMIAIGAAVAAVAVRQLTPREYTSYAQLAIDPRGLSALDRDVTPRDGNADGRIAQVNTQMQVLVSDSVLAPVVVSQKLANDPEYVQPGGFVSHLKGLLKSGVNADLNLIALNGLKDAVGVSLVPSSFVVTLSVTSTQPDKSRRLVEAIANQYMTLQGEDRRDAARKVGEGLLERLSQLRARVAKAEDAIETFKTKHNIVDAGGQLNNEQQLTELTNQLGLARAQTSQMRARYDQTQRIAASGDVAGDLPEAVKSQTITALRGQFAQIKRQADSLASTHGPRHPALLEMRAQAQSLTRQIDAELKRISSAAKRDYEQSRAIERDLTGKLNALKSQSTDVNQSRIQLRQLEREAKASRAVYETFLNRAREVSEQENIDTTNIKIISPPLLPLKADGPPTLIIAFIAGMLGLSFGITAAVGRDAFSGIAHTAQSIAADSGLPVIAQLPIAATRSFANKKQAGGVPLFAGGATDRDCVSALGMISDTLRTYRRHHTQQVLLVMSAAEPLERASVSLNLAVAENSAGSRVLLVDADHTDAALSRAIAGPAAAGLESVLSGRRALHEAVHGIAGSSLAVLPNFLLAQSGAFAPVEQLQHRLLAQASSYDLVIIDAARLKAGMVPTSFARVATDILVVARAGETRSSELANLRESLGANAAKVIGAALLTPPADGAKKPEAFAQWASLAPAFGHNAPNGAPVWYHKTQVHS